MVVQPYLSCNPRAPRPTILVRQQDPEKIPEFENGDASTLTVGATADRDEKQPVSAHALLGRRFVRRRIR
jgi:hypothetical protein